MKSSKDYKRIVQFSGRVFLSEILQFMDYSHLITLKVNILPFLYSSIPSEKLSIFQILCTNNLIYSNENIPHNSNIYSIIVWSKAFPFYTSTFNCLTIFTMNFSRRIIINFSSWNVTNFSWFSILN